MSSDKKGKVKRGRGRPRIDSEAKDVILSIRLSAEERAEVTAAAEKAGVSTSEWARGVMLRRRRW